MSVVVLLISSIFSTSALTFNTTEQNRLKNLIKWNISFTDYYFYPEAGLGEISGEYAVELYNLRIVDSGSKLTKHQEQGSLNNYDYIPRVFVSPIKFENDFVPNDFYDIDIKTVGLERFPSNVRAFHWIGIGYRDEDFSKWEDNPHLIPNGDDIDILNNHRITGIDPNREAYLIMSFEAGIYIDSIYNNVMYELAGIGGTEVDKSIFMQGYNAGHSIGYKEGYSKGLAENKNIVVWDNPIAEVINAVITAPFTFINNLLNFELGGIVISGVVFTVLTVVFVVWVLKFFL